MKINREDIPHYILKGIGYTVLGIALLAMFWDQILLIGIICIIGLPFWVYEEHKKHKKKSDDLKNSGYEDL